MRLILPALGVLLCCVITGKLLQETVGVNIEVPHYLILMLEFSVGIFKWLSHPCVTMEY